MKTVALVIFSFFTLLSVLIYFNKNYKYEEYIFLEKSEETKAYLINLNLATWYDFASLPGISDKLAQDIVKDRDTNGRFDQVEDLKRVKGIGSKKFAEIKGYLTLKI